MNHSIDRDKKETHWSVEFYEFLPVAFFKISKKGIINYVNVPGQKLTNRTATELLHTPFESILVENSKSIFHQFLKSINFEEQNQTCLVEINKTQDLVSKVSLHGNLSADAEWIQLVVIECLIEAESNISFKQEFEDISNVANIGRWELDLVTGKLNWSNKIYELFELNADVFQPSYEAFLSVIHPEDREKVEQAYSNSLIDKKKYEIEHRLIMLDGHVKWVRETCYSIFDPFDKPLKSIGTCQDITRQKELEIYLQKSEKNYSSLVENTDSLVWSCDQNGHFKYLNPAWEKLLGYPKHEMIDRPFTEFQPIEISIRDKEAFNKFNLNGDVTKNGYETIFLTKNGETKYLIFYSTPIKNDSDNIVGSHGTANDITFKHTLDLKLEETYFELGQRQYAIDQHAIVAITNLDGDIIYTNRLFCKISKYSREELIGKNHRIINSGYHPAEFFKDLYKTIKSGNTWYGEIKNKAKDGSYYWVATTIAPIKNARGEVKKYLSIRTEITETKEAGEKIKLLLKEKALILIEVHHRIKNNMNTIYSLLKIEANSQEDLAHKTILLDASNRVRSMMLLYDKLYRSENTDTISVKEYFPILISEILNIFPNKEKITTNIEVEPVVISAKTISSIGIIINELVTNSIKYSFLNRDSGKISFSAKTENQLLVICYEDDGIPINSSVDLQSPNSFGLNLINMLVKQLKGNVYIESSLGTKYRIEIKV
ncbi:PAS domain S-box protein [Leptospira wolbachii serovar Codice str. CDC]|uniref:PAS domain S-box protein n=1 Tax=Leptospira wolbachii serovar Codice str. CDC TaxID=1218599 RepID=R9A4A4_9LEPT|nr:PAS domain S-box protein [Leptospira wolbachii]EOQ96824.1 PAS domain S-box protein [Leptospira wolbachii serovar Codice str. CDC]